MTLFGTVPTEAARRAAETEVRKVDAVKGVENDLQVVPQVSAAAVEHTDERVKDAIEKRLSRRVGSSPTRHRRGGGKRRRPPDRDGPGQPDRLTALTVARTTDGVRSVVGDLTVKTQ